MASPPSTGSDPVKHSLPLQNGREMRNNGVSPTWPVENSERAELPQEVNKEERSKLVIDLDYLKQLETKITHLQHRVETCERGPESLAGSHISEPQISLVSDSAISQASTQRARRSRSPEIIENIDGPPITRSMGSIKDKEGNLKVSSLQIARWKCFDPLDSRSLENEDGVTVGKFPIGNVVNRSLVTVTQEYDRNKQFWRRRVEIASSVFYYLLKGMAQDNIDDFFLDGILYMVEPLMILFLNRKQLLQHLESASESAQVIEETRFILGFMKNEFSRESRTIDNFESATPPNMISYQDLWLLYRPGTLVFSHVNDGYEAFIVSFVEGLNTRLPSQVDRHGFTRCDVFCWSIDYDGEIFGRVWSIHCIAPFEGVRAIGSLALVPEKYLPNTNIVKESLISRGRHFLSLQGQHYREYANNQRNGVPTRVMIDQLTYSRRNRWLISIDRKQRPSDPNTYNIYSEWARYCQPNRTSAVKDRLPRRSPGPRSFVRPFDEELCFRDYKDDRDGDFEECQTDPYRRYGCDRPQQRIVDEFDKYDIFDPKTEVDELVLLLCPQHIRGFCFSDKVWSM